MTAKLFAKKILSESSGPVDFFSLVGKFFEEIQNTKVLHVLLFFYYFVGTRLARPVADWASWAS